MPTKSDQFWTIYVWFCRIFGVLTAIGLWGVGVETCYRAEELGIYLLCAAVVVTFLELIFVVNFWILLCTVRDDELPTSCCVVGWKRLMWFDSWKKGVAYLLMSIGCFVRPFQAWLALISGGMLVVTALLYCIKTFADRRERPSKNRAYDRFDVEDAINDDLTGSAGSISGRRSIVRSCGRDSDSSRRPLPTQPFDATEQDDAWEV